jgi:hypothetical protein
VCLAAGQLDERQTSNLLPGGKAESGREMTAYLEKRRKGLRIASSTPPALSLSKVLNSKNSPLRVNPTVTLPSM